jgi:hypothetical protein
MPSTARFAYDVSTGEHVMLGQANAPTATDFTDDVLDKQSQRDKRLARKQRQRARKRAAKRAEVGDGGPGSCPAAAATPNATPSPPPPMLILLAPAAERVRSARAQTAAYLRDTCFALLHATHPAQRPPNEDEADYAGRLQRATEEWVAVLVLYRRALNAGELTVHSGVGEVATHTQTLWEAADAVHERLHAATMAAWREQLREVVGV